MNTLLNPMDFPAEITLTLSGQSICPVTQQPDQFRLTVRYEPRKVVLEFESFRDWLAGYAERTVYHETLVAEVRAVLLDLLQPAWLEVVDHYQGEGLTYDVRTRWSSS